MDITNLFDSYKSEPNPEHWRGFPELMSKLGFEMDCYHSAPKFNEFNRVTHSEKEIQDQLLSEMTNWTAQEVGNYILSRYRYLTHWCDYGYAKEKGAYFFERAFPILERLLTLDWEKRNTVPTIEEFSEMVISRFVCDIDPKLQKQADIFLSDEGPYHIRRKYKEYLEQLHEQQITTPMFYGRCVSEAVFFLRDMFS